MKHYIYPRLAVNGIRKNKRLYIPYILTCIGMVMMFYIISFLSSSSTIEKLNGGSVLQSCLVLGCGVIGLFSLVFLFYTNSFLIRRRKRNSVYIIFLVWASGILRVCCCGKALSLWQFPF